MWSTPVSLALASADLSDAARSLLSSSPISSGSFASFSTRAATCRRTPAARFRAFTGGEYSSARGGSALSFPVDPLVCGLNPDRVVVHMESGTSVPSPAIMADNALFMVSGWTSTLFKPMRLSVLYVWIVA